MFRNVISPIQAWLLSQKRCVGCGKELILGKHTPGKNGNEKVVCACGRIYVHEVKNDKYHRALLEEV